MVRELFDPDALRALRDRSFSVRAVEQPTLVLGSTQRLDVIDPDAVERAGVRILHRRSGGGAVLLEPSNFIWLDTWLPRNDPLWDEDVRRARAWLGRWWAESIGCDDLVAHSGRPISSRWSNWICFAGVASGELTYRGHKLTGVAQWRCREGSLTHSLAYLRSNWNELARLMGLGSDVHTAAHDLQESTVTLTQLGLEETPLIDSLIRHLPESPSWKQGLF